MMSLLACFFAFEWIQRGEFHVRRRSQQANESTLLTPKRAPIRFWAISGGTFGFGVAGVIYSIARVVRVAVKPKKAEPNQRTTAQRASRVADRRRSAKKMAYQTLIAADIYRDGGSLEARFQCEGGGFESIWLAAKPEDRSYTRFVHGDLRISTSAEGAQTGRVVAMGSQEEAEILTRLISFMQSPKVDVPFSERTPIDYYLHTVADLITAIPNRKE